MFGKLVIKIIFSLVLIFLAPPSKILASTSSNPDIRKINESFFLKLDSIIAEQAKIKSEKEKRISFLESDLIKTRIPEQKVNLYKSIISEFSTFNSDSSIHYVDRAIDYIQNNVADNYNLIADIKLMAVTSLALQGRFKTADDFINSLDVNLLNPDNKAALYDRKAYLATMENVFMEDNNTDWQKILNQNNLWRDSIFSANPSDEKNWLWLPLAMKIEIDDNRKLSALPDAEESIKKLNEYIEENPDFSRLNAINYYWLYRYFKAAGNEEEMLKNLTLSAINDAAIDNHDPIATQDLAVWLFENGDLDRAYDYLSYAVSQANSSHYRVRMVELSQILPTVRKAYLSQINKRDKQMRGMVISLSIVAFFLILSLIILFAFHFKLKKTKSKLDDVLGREKQVNAELTETVRQRDSAIYNLGMSNSELKDANNQKLRLLTYAMKISADNINGLEEYRKKLLAKYRSKEITDMGVILDDPDLIIDKYKSFHAEFDKMVLTIMPDFYNFYFEANPDETKDNKDKLRKSKSLSTKMRIFALRTLGVEKSEDIAKLLNISIRTVYNNRIGN